MCAHKLEFTSVFQGRVTSEKAIRLQGLVRLGSSVSMLGAISVAGESVGEDI